MKLNQRKQMMLLAGLLFFAFICVSTVSAQTSAFSYQGRLEQSGVPSPGPVDFEFRLFDALNGGAILGTQQVLNVQVNNGSFSTAIDFGSAAFSGQPRWL